MLNWQTKARHRTRLAEMSIVMKELANTQHHFSHILEIGSGEGLSAFSLSQMGKVFPSDLRIPNMWYAQTPNFVVCDAEHLPYPDETFDMVFSSHVLEHISDRVGALNELRRLTTPNALFVHVVPTQFWKLLSIGTYYPDQVLAAIRRVARWLSGRSLKASGSLTTKTLRRSRLVPPVHGTNTSTWGELREFRPSEWHRLFREAGYVCMRSLPLLAYSPANTPILPANRKLVHIGLFSSIVFILRKAEISETSR